MSHASVVSRIAHESCLRSKPLLAGNAPWWDELPDDFHRQDESFQLQLSDRIRVRSTAASDVLMRTLGASLVGGLAMPFGYHPLQLRRLRKEAGFYQALADRGDARAVFETPQKHGEISRRKPWQPTFRPKDGTVEDLTFESRFVPLNPSQRKSYLRHKRNRIAHARYWYHSDRPRPTIILIHGFSADLYFINQWFFAIPWLYRLGCNVLLFTLPFHGPRQTRISPFSGHGFFAGGVQRINEAFAHAIHDLRVFMRFLRREHDTPEIGVTGVSLGGFTASLLASVDRTLSFAIPNVPVVSLADLILEWEPAGSIIRTALNAMRFDLKEIRHTLAATAPVTFSPKISRERLMIIAGVGDRLAPPKHSRLLWEHWDRCAIHWFPGSHLLHLDKGAYFKEMARFMSQIGFIENRPG